MLRMLTFEGLAFLPCVAVLIATGQASADDRDRR